MASRRTRRDVKNSHETRKLLNLKTQEKRTVSIKSFGNAKSENILDVVEFTVHAKHGEKINVEALVSEICLRIESQAIETTVEQYPHLQNLTLADSNVMNSSLKIDVLIGCRVYWRFIGTKQKRGPEGPVAIESKLGFILSGPTEIYGNKNTDENVFSSHLMRVETKITPEQEIKKSFSVVHNTKREIKDEKVNNEAIMRYFEDKTVYENYGVRCALYLKETGFPVRNPVS